MCQMGVPSGDMCVAFARQTPFFSRAQTTLRRLLRSFGIECEQPPFKTQNAAPAQNSASRGRAAPFSKPTLKGSPSYVSKGARGALNKGVPRRSAARFETPAANNTRRRTWKRKKKYARSPRTRSIGIPHVTRFEGRNTHRCDATARETTNS